MCMLVYGTCMVLTGIVTQIFLSWMTHNLEHLLSFLIEKPRVAHLHGAGTLSLDCVVNNASIRSVVDMYRCYGLGMSKFV